MDASRRASIVGHQLIDTPFGLRDGGIEALAIRENFRPATAAPAKPDHSSRDGPSIFPKTPESWDRKSRSLCNFVQPAVKLSRIIKPRHFLFGPVLLPVSGHKTTAWFADSYNAEAQRVSVSVTSVAMTVTS
jgi:hypothetical protein